MTFEKTSEILQKMRPHVNDFFSVTALHYLNGGEEAIRHLCFLINAIIDNINNSSLPELNTVFANILHKGHGKAKNLDSSYRTISTCPLIAKVFDTYIGEIESTHWESVQAETQFQGKGLSHEHSALLLTEIIQYSLFEDKIPIFALFLDAKSAFDKALVEILCRRLYLDGTTGQNLSFIMRRLQNRITFCEWNNELMGPIIDELGLEQGGKLSSDEWKIYNNEQLTTPQETDFGTSIGDVHVAAIGQADDCVLVSSDLHKLKFLLHLTLQYCEKYQVLLSPGKTKLQLYMPPGRSLDKNYLRAATSLQIDGTAIELVDTTEHVGVLRSTDGNLPHLLQRFSSHTKALHSVLHAGLARGHRGNPAASIRVEKLYGVPVLLSGTASLVLKQTEYNALDHHYKVKLQNLQRLHEKTPNSVVWFLAGSLPASALLHLKQLTLFGMISRLPQNILPRIAKYVLTTSSDSSKSWFFHIRALSQQYQLPHPLLLLQNPLTKTTFKKIIKSKVQDYWENSLRHSASTLSSLAYFHPEFMSLSVPHPLWTTCDSNPFEIAKSTVQAKLLSGRYRTDKLLKHFSKNNTGNCSLCEDETEGSIEHLLVLCPTLAQTRQNMFNMLEKGELFSDKSKKLIYDAYSSSVPDFVQLLLDSSVLPEVISACQNNENYILSELFKFSRTWCFNVHSKRMKILGQWRNKF